MISTANISLSYGSKKLFEDVNIKFVPGNCYGLIGANGAGKSTFLKILSGEVSPNTGTVSITPGERLAMLKQNHFEYDQMEVLKTVMLGQPQLSSLVAEKDALYAKTEMTDEEGIKAAELEALFADLGGWTADSDAATLLTGVGVGTEAHGKLMRELSGADKVKVLLAQTLFGNPDILLLDEPTNHLDIAAIHWLEEFLASYEKTVIVVSHDRHFLNHVCTHMADIDYNRITLHTGNYDFWHQSSQLVLKLQQDKLKKTKEKAEELKTFIARFSANASKSKQATSRKKMLEKLNIEDIMPSTRRYPFVHFRPEREAGNQLLTVDGLTKTIDGTKVLNGVSFTIHKGDKVALAGDDEIARSTLLSILAGEMKPDAGVVQWGVTTIQSFFPKDNGPYFDGKPLTLVDWMRQYSEDQSESFVRGFLGRMLFSGEEAMKKTNVLSGGERVRCMLSRMMLSGANVLLFDEPTNHLDLESITSVNDAIIKFPGTVLFTSHDHQFTQTVANRVIEIQGGAVMDYGMGYDDYLVKRGIGV